MHLGRREQALLLLFALAVVFGLGVKYALNRQVAAVEEPVVTTGENPPPEICVHVAGAVYRPGVYRLSQGSRVLDAVQEARAHPDADLDALNLAQLLEDGQKILVPVKMPPVEPGGAATGNPFASAVGPGTAASTVSRESKININRADARTLEELPGIGPALARRIVEYRAANGTFSSVDELINVPGIGEKKLAQLRDRACVR